MHTMYIDDQTYSVDGRTYRRILLRNSYRKDGKICHDTVANLSLCSDEEIRAMKYALSHKHDLSNIEKKAGGEAAQEEYEQGLSFGAVWVLFQLAKRYGIVETLGNSEDGKRVLWMIIATLIGSVSRLSITRLAKSHAACDILGLNSFCEDDLYESLDWLEKQQKRIEQRLFKIHYQDKVPSLFLYDVTSSYFEGVCNELAEHGYNRDGKKGKKQIVIGLLTDEDGRPIACEVFKGNTQDPKTFQSQLQKLCSRFSIKTATLVGDRGMIKTAQIKEITSEHFHYITAITKPQIQKMLTEGSLQYELFDETVTEIDLKNLRYILKRNPVRVQEIRESRNSKYQKLEEVCLKKNLYLQEHARAQVEIAKKKLEAKASQLKIDSWITLHVKGKKLILKKDPEKLKKESLLDGCYVIKTDLPKDDFSKDFIHDRYKSLAEVEWAFRTMKTVLLHLRGIFVRKANRTRGHVFVMMLAYLIAFELRRLWESLEITVEEGIQELTQLCTLKKKIQNISIQIIPAPRENIKKLFEKANVMLPDAIPDRNIPVYTRKKLVEERRTHLNK